MQIIYSKPKFQRATTHSQILLGIIKMHNILKASSSKHKIVFNNIYILSKNIYILSKKLNFCNFLNSIKIKLFK